MQPRGQPPSAARPGPARPFAPVRALLPPLLLLLLALRGAAAAATALPDPRSTDGTDDPEPPAPLPPRMLEQAARVALHFLNFRTGSPSALRALDKVLEGDWQDDPAKGYYINLVFNADSYHLQEDREPRSGKCSAKVFFKDKKPRPDIVVSCLQLSEKNRTLQEDHLLYETLKEKDALSVGNIPDDEGNIDPSVSPIWDLALLGTSYVMWERTTQSSYYYPLRLSSVKQWKTKNNAIDFDYVAQLHELPSQEIIPCRIHLIWYPGKPLKVKYHCEETQTPEEAASGTEEGSALAPTEFSNF